MMSFQFCTRHPFQSLYGTFLLCQKVKVLKTVINTTLGRDLHSLQGKM